LVQVGDNKAEKDMAEFGSAHSAATRAALRYRWAVRQHMPDSSLVVGVHVLRDRLDEVDRLTKWDVTAAPQAERQKFIQQLSARFLRPLRVLLVRAAPGADDRLTFLLRAHDAAGTDRVPLPCPHVPVCRLGVWRQVGQGALDGDVGPCDADGAGDGGT
jgi:hypothetical protein